MQLSSLARIKVAIIILVIVPTILTTAPIGSPTQVWVHVSKNLSVLSVTPLERFITFAMFFVYTPIIIVYGLYPLKFTSEEFLRKRGYENAVIEFGFIKSVLFVTILLLSTITIVNLLRLYYLTLSEPGSELLPLSFYYFNYFVQLIYIILLVVVGASLRIITQLARKEFRFCFARACCKIMLIKEDEFEKTKYLVLALDSYNKYLRRRSNFEISHIKKIYSKFLYAEIYGKSEIIRIVCESLEDDRLKLARYLSTISKVPETELFVSVTILQKLRIFGVFLGAAIPIIVSIIQLLIRPGK